MKDRLRKRRQSMVIPEKYRVIPDPSKYDPDGWPKGYMSPLWRGTLRRGPNGVLYRDTMGLGCYDPKDGRIEMLASDGTWLDVGAVARDIRVSAEDMAQSMTRLQQTIASINEYLRAFHSADSPPISASDA